MKKKALERQKQLENGELDGKENEPELVIPAMARLETKAYKPGMLNCFFFIITCHLKIL